MLSNEEVKRSYLNVFRNEVARCDMFLATLADYVEEMGADPELDELRKQWELERAVWQAGVDEMEQA